MINKMKICSLYCFCALLFASIQSSKAEKISRWKLCKGGEIAWNATNEEVHADHIEMSGKRISSILYWKVDKGTFTVKKELVWPFLRTIPNNTYGSLKRESQWNVIESITVNGKSLRNEKQVQCSLKGILTVSSLFDHGWEGKWKLVRSYFPSTDQPCFIEQYLLVNLGDKVQTAEIPQVSQQSATDAKSGVEGSYQINMCVEGSGCYTVAPGDTVKFAAITAANKKGTQVPHVSCSAEMQKRKELVAQWMNNLVLESPDPIIDRMFAFSKIRASESIYETKGGPMHGPGGGTYYAAIWANDQAEYANPFFPYLGYNYGNEAALNAYMHFARFMNKEWKPIPSSIIAEGFDIWNGAGDRGDAAMIAYGASRYALSLGDKDVAEQLWPLINWCLEFCHRKLNASGVVASDTDELENRFPSGDANLCTSSLYYDALLSASYLSKELHKGQAKEYQRRAHNLRTAMNDYFPANIEGFDTYAYYKGNTKLRAWICIPLTVGIDERAEGTLKALYSPLLWTANGLLTQSGSKDFWDRSTLYALRGTYIAGETELATQYLHEYSKTRLLGNHVPYAIEAWPEGGQRHLSAESALYARIISEGLFGIRPIGLHRFTLQPRLPKDWNYMRLKNIQAFHSNLTIEVKRIRQEKIKVTITGKDIKTKEYTSNGKSPIVVNL